MKINNKTVFITGGAHGIGAAIVKECLLRGAKHVLFLDIDLRSGSNLENELINDYGRNKVKFVECDITNDDQLFEAYKMIYEENGGIDCVINNAGIAQESRETYKKLIEINYTAVVTSTFQGLELMRKDHGGNGGTVINVSSALALCQTSPTIFVYGGSKSAVLQFSNCIGMQNYFVRTGVRVITVCFGCTDTKIFNKMKGFDSYVDQEIETIKTNVPFQSAESAARGLMDVYEKGESGDTWVVVSGKSAINWTEKCSICPILIDAYKAGESGDRYVVTLLAMNWTQNVRENRKIFKYLPLDEK